MNGPHSHLFRLSGTVIGLLFAAPVTKGVTRGVCADGSGQYPTIQAGITAAATGDEVVLCPGIYRGVGNRDLDFAGKAITVRSNNPGDADVVTNTIIDCQSAGRGFFFHTNETSAAIVDGLTITNGVAIVSNNRGGGIECLQSSPTIRNCRILWNTGSAGGGGIDCFAGAARIANCLVAYNSATGTSAGGGGVFLSSSSGSTSISDCIITNNTAYTGGGLYLSGSTALVQVVRCTINQNRANVNGGGMTVNLTGATIDSCKVHDNVAREAGGIICNSSNPTFINCTIARNSTQTGAGGGMYCNCSNPTLTNCSLRNNTAATGSGGGGGGIFGTNSNPRVTNCILWNDSPQELLLSNGTPVVTFSDVFGGWTGTGNINVDPLFAFADDSRLLPGSPCVDAGTNTPAGGLPGSDAEGKPRPQDGNSDTIVIADQGAYESSPGVPSIALASNSFEFVRFVDQADPPAQKLVVRNAGAGTLSWSAAASKPWLIVSPANGDSTGEPDEINLSSSSQGLSVGDYSALLTIGDPNAANTPRFLRIALHVGATIHVPTDAPTIQNAINSARSGDLVVVADGTYTGIGNRGIDFLGKAITVRSEHGAGQCIIDCQKSARGFYFHTGEQQTSILSGFTIQNGESSLNPDPDSGGAIYCLNSGPLIRGCVLTRNNATYAGGGISCVSASPTISNCQVFQNTLGGGFFADYAGAGISCDGSAGAIIASCNVYQNKGANGCGIWVRNNGKVTIKQCTVIDNAVGGIGGYGNMTIVSTLIAGNAGNGISVRSGGQAAIIDCLVTANSTTDRGGGLRVMANATATVTDCTFSANTATNSGGAFHCDNPSTSVIANSILWNDTSPLGAEISIFTSQINPSSVTVRRSDIKGGQAGVFNASAAILGPGNINANPLFVNPNGIDNYAPTWFDNNFHLRENSPCIDAASNADVPGDVTDLDGDGDVAEKMPWDLDGKSRFSDDPNVPDTGSGTSPVVDMGAFEFFLDCNGNGVWDTQDISSGTSSDVNGNMMPDECDPDCNHNSVPDDLDISHGASQDANHNLVPDECESNLAYVSNLRTGVVYGLIQPALDAALTGDVLVASVGVYSGIGNRDLDFHGKALTLRSMNPQDASIVASTVIDCGNVARGFHFHSGEGTGSVVSGFTITHGYELLNGVGDFGAGIYCENASSPSIDHCVISAGIATFGGGIYYKANCIPHLDSCQILNNIAVEASDGSGGGIYCTGSSGGKITNCTISGNSTTLRGGGISFQSSSASVSGCAISQNRGTDGGGISCIGSTVSINSCTFNGNTMSGGGGGLSCGGTSNVSVTDCTFNQNSAVNLNFSGPSGGGINSDSSTLIVRNCVFNGQLARDGGAVHLSSSNATIVNTTMRQNTATVFGGALYAQAGNLLLSNCTLSQNAAPGSGGAIYLQSLNSAATLVNCLVVANSSQSNGGGINCRASSPNFVNCTIANNSSQNNGGGLYISYSAAPILANSILWGNTAKTKGPHAMVARETAGDPVASLAVSFSVLQDAQAGIAVDAGCTLNYAATNSSSDPRFADPAGADHTLGTADDDWHVKFGSPCIDSGDNTAVPADIGDVNGNGNVTEKVPLDVGGQPRFRDDPLTPDIGNGSTPFVDRGAFEFYPDCNHNNVLDTVETSNGTSLDCDHDFMPDECEPDTDQDGIIDGCDKCPTVPYADNADTDNDGIGDACDNCPFVSNADQADMDRDGRGDACDDDMDGDGMPTALDNCPRVANPGQEDADHDRVGDLCDQCPNSLPGAIVDTTGCTPQVKADFDADGDVDQSDFGHLQICLSGANVTQNSPLCQNTKLDADSDVDVSDLGIFLGCLRGAQIAADPHCIP